MPATPYLTRRERQLANLVERALKNASIAREMGITEQTVKIYLFRIFKKFGYRKGNKRMRLGRDIRAMRYE